VIVATHDERLLPLADRVVEMTPRAPSDAQIVKQLVLEAGQTVFEQGDRSDLVYVIEEGEVEIVRVRDDGAEDRLASLGAGSTSVSWGHCSGCAARPPHEWSPAPR
jgi:putative ABC transport system ATP-binding protein